MIYLDFFALCATSKSVVDRGDSRRKCCTNSRRNRLFTFAVEKIGRSGWCRAADKASILFLHGSLFKDRGLMQNITITTSTEPTDYTFTETKQRQNPVEEKREKLIRLLKTYGASAPNGAKLSDLEKLYAHVLELEAPDMDFPEEVRDRMNLKTCREIAALATMPISQFRECVRLALKHNTSSICPGLSLSEWVAKVVTGKLYI